MKIINTLFNTQQSKSRYIFKAFLISIIPALIISFLLHGVDPSRPSVHFHGSKAVIFFSVVLFSPIVETLILWLFIRIINIFIKNTWTIAIISALLWASLHSMLVSGWGLTIFWSFVVFSIAFIEWKKISTRDALIVSGGIHMAQNFFAFLFI